ncbi:MAG: sigma-70 family RNA polymerase sigma factor, partial [Thermoleophilia bacterium]|nr:sigma-70 family RNA polymerase sigma factor [Thermoleophilia bacterium]
MAAISQEARAGDSRPGGRASDQALARRVSRGDDRAFEALYERHASALYRYSLSIVRDPEDAREALQGAMLNALRAMRAGEVPVNVRAWLYRVTHNASVSVLRAAPPPSEAIEDHDEPGDGDVFATVAAREDLRQLRADLDQLSVAQRSALVLHEVEGMDYQTIAEALETEPTAVKHLVHEARKNLVDFGAGRDMACEGVRDRIAEGDARTLRSRRMSAHLRACTGCAAFLEGLRMGRQRLAAVFPFPPSMAQEILQGVMQQAGAAGAAGGAAGAAGGAPREGGSGAGAAAGSSAFVAAATAMVTLAVGVSGLAREADRPPGLPEGDAAVLVTGGAGGLPGTIPAAARRSPGATPAPAADRTRPAVRRVRTAAARVTPA